MIRHRCLPSTICVFHLNFGLGLTCRSRSGFAVLVVSFCGRLSAVLPSSFLLAVFFGLSDGWSGLSFLATLALGLLLVVRAK